MTDIEKLRTLIAQIDQMLASKINPSSEEFTTWRTKTERLLGKIYGEGSKEHKGFRDTSFWSLIFTCDSDVDSDNIEACYGALQTTRAKLKVYLEELEEDEEQLPTFEEEEMALDYTKVFIVHGHDGELKEKVARVLEKQGIEAIILSEKANKGRTIIEKFESYAENVAAAICLYTPDDNMADGSKRARQNVVFETGYFYGKIGRDRTIIISEDDALNLSDLQGVVYVSKNNWQVDVFKELREIGYAVDMNKLLE